MRLEQLSPLWLCILLPLIVLLYILKEKAEERRVSSLYLWQEAFKSLEARTPWEKLKNNLLLYLQLLLMLLFILALCGPYLNKGGRAYSDVVLAIDVSGSMNSTFYEDGESTGKSRLSMAKKKALDYVDSLPENTKITLITSNQTASLVFAGKTDHYSVKEEIRELKETDLSGNLAPAVDLIASMQSQWKDYQSVLFTDEAVDIEKIHGVVENLGSGGRNLSVTQMSHREREDGKTDILVQVENTGTEFLASDINLYLDDELEEIQSVSLQPKEKKTLYFQGLQVKETITAELNEKDDLLSDNTAYECIREKKEKSVLLVTEKNVFLEKALAGLPDTAVYKTNDVSHLEEAGGYDFYVFDGIFPEKLPFEGSMLFINPEEDMDSLFTVTGEEENIWVEEKESDFGFGVASLKAIKTPDWAEAFYEAGEYGAGFSGEKDGQWITVLAFDIHQSELPLLPEFPLKIYEIAMKSLENGLLSANRIITGETVTVHGENGSWTYTDTDRCGLVKIEDGKERETLAINFPEEEMKCWQSIAAQTGTTGEKAPAEALKVSLPLLKAFLILILILLFIEAVVYLKQGTYSQRSKEQKRLILAVRGLVLLCLLLAWINPSVVLGSHPASTVFLIDASDSVAGKEEEAVEFVKEALRELPEKEEAGVIAFGKEARVEQFMSSERRFSQLETVISGSATNLKQAVMTAIGMFPDNAPKRLVLLTDGKENEGSIEELSTLLKEKKIKLLVKRWESGGTAEVSVESVSVPDKVNIGDVFKVNLHIKSNVETSAVLSLYAGNEKKAERLVELQKGSNQFVFTDIQTAPGLKSYRAIIEPYVDSVTMNNEYSAYTQAEAPDTVLLIEGKAGQGEELSKLLEMANVAYQRTTPVAAPRTLTELLAYRSVLLLDVYAPDLPDGFMNNIESYIKDYGGGMIAIGGSNSFALGGYRDTPLETVLPVDMDLQGEKEIPKMAMVMVIDRSGSMSAGDGRISQLTLAKEAAVEALNSLRPEDEVGVLAFESTYDWIVKLGTADDREDIESKIASIGLGGGTSIYPAVEEALKALSGSDAKRKHIILLTDGQDGYSQYDELLKRLDAENVSLSTVAVGEGSDQNLLGWLAEKGKGRSYYTDINSDIPRIFAQEVFLAAKDYLVNREFTPVITSNSGLIREAVAEGVPKLYGYIAATPKPRAQVHLASDTEDPIYTTWRYGLGKTAAFNTDAENNWTREWAAWDGYPLLLKNMISWTMTDSYSDENKLEVVQKGSSLKLSYELKEYSENSSAEAVLTDEKGNREVLELKQEKPGSFAGEISLPETGIYSISVRQKEGETVTAVRNTAAALQYSEEYRLNEDISAFERFVRGNEGRYIDVSSQVASDKPEQVKGRTNLGSWFLLLGIFLFLADIIIRRFRLPKWKRKQKVKAEEKFKVEKPEAKKPEMEKPEMEKPEVEKPEKTRLNTAELLKKKSER